MNVQDLYQLQEKLFKAVETVAGGVCNRIDVNKDLKVYKVKNVLRIDAKLEEVADEG